MKVLITQSCLTLCNPMDCSSPGFSVMEFSRQEYWSGLLFPSPGDLPDSGMDHGSPTLQADSLPSEPPGTPTTNLNSVLKSRDITFLTEFLIIKAMVLPVVMYGCESWTIKKAEPKNWCFQTVVLEKTLESPLDYREMKPVLKKINPEYSLEGL